MAYKKIQEQENVLNTTDKNIIVSASAGSGKTSVMIRKILGLIVEKNVKVKDLLVLTYTNAAASEMKQKLISEMSNQDNIKVLSQIDDVPLSDISTFDSFCQKLVKRYFYILEIDPSFNILQGSEQKEFFKKAFQKAVKIFKKNNYQKYFDLFDCYAGNRTDKNIYEIITKLNSFAMSILDYDKFKQLSYQLFEGDINNKASSIILKDIKNDVKIINQKLLDLHKLSSDFGYIKYCEYINNLLSVADVIQNAQNFGNLIDNIVEYKFEKSPNQNKNDFTIMPQIKNVKEWLLEICESIKKYNSCKSYTKSIQSCKNITECYFDLNEEFIKQYDLLKTNKNYYDYNDIERLTIKLFQNEEILNTIKQNYKHIFVDEFQDANALQEKIIMSLKNGNNLFFVGDLKQAIYGFRQSNSKIFEKITYDFDNDKNSCALSLNCNFRTTKLILDFINKVFNVVMTEKTAALNYEKKAQLEAQAEFKDEKNPCVELNIIYKPKEEKQAVTKVYKIKNDIEENALQNVEANFIAEKITQLLNEEIYDIKLEKYRKVEYKDIAILFRTRANQQQFISTFSQLNIPILEDSNSDLEQTYDVEVLINLIKIALNIKNDYALASVMMSSLFEFNANEMLKIRNQSQDKFFYECVKNYNINDEIYIKIQKMLNTIEKFYNILMFNGINKALIYILNEQNYEYKILNSFNGISRYKNIQDFIQSFNNSKFNLCASEYINFLEENTREQKVVAGVGSDNVVTMTTMHSSKGLEWPIVIIPSLESKFYRAPKSGEISLNEEMGAGVKYYDNISRKKYPSVFYDVIENYNKDSDFSERLRLLYVALTRPKNRLILVGTTEKLNYQKFESDRQVRRAQDYLSIIVNSLSEADITKINSQTSCFNLFKNSNYVCNLIKAKEYSLTSPESKLISKQEHDESEVLKLCEYVNKEYFNYTATKIAQKNSVSSILKQEDVFANKNSAPDKLLINEHLQDVKLNELGSLYHKIIEMFNFNNIISNTEIYKIIKQIQKTKEFSDDTIKAVDVSIIYKNLQLLKDLTQGYNLIKEHTFVMQIPYNEIQNSMVNDKVLVQGICDLIAINNNSTILIDYKYSVLSAKSLKQKYNKQLYLYSKAIEYGLNKKVDKVYILSLKNAELIECNPYK